MEYQLLYTAHQWAFHFWHINIIEKDYIKHPHKGVAFEIPQELLKELKKRKNYVDKQDFSTFCAWGSYKYMQHNLRADLEV